MGPSPLCYFLQQIQLWIINTSAPAKSRAITNSAGKKLHNLLCSSSPGLPLKGYQLQKFSPCTCQRSIWKKWPSALNWGPAVAHSVQVKGGWMAAGKAFTHWSFHCWDSVLLLKLKLAWSFAVAMGREPPNLLRAQTKSELFCISRICLWPRSMSAQKTL